MKDNHEEAAPATPEPGNNAVVQKIPSRLSRQQKAAEVIPVTQGQLPPHCADSEKAALGNVILAAESGAGHADLFEKLNASFFYDQRHLAIYRTVKAICDAGETPTTASIITRSKERGTTGDCGGISYVADLADGLSPHVFPEHLDKLRDKAARRGLLRLSTEASRLAYDPTIDPTTAANDFADISARVLTQGTSPIVARPMSALVAPRPDDENELVRRRYLDRGATLLLVGQSGQGKSSLAMQLSINWALGRECFGLAPALPMRVLIIQSENDDGDMYEMFHGVCAGLNLSAKDRATVGERILQHVEDISIGLPFCKNVVAPLVALHRPDLLIIDPALAYLGGDTKEAEAVGKFLRQGLNPILHRNRCGLLLIHHTTKQRADGAQSTADFLYSGAGSIEWTNHARAVLALETKGKGCYRLHAPKRGSRIGWRNADGEAEFDRYIRHDRAPGQICWHEVNASEVETVTRTGKGKSDLLAHVPLDGSIPMNVLIEKGRTAGIGEKKGRAFLDELLADQKAHLWLVRRAGTNPLKCISRHPQPQPKLALDPPAETPAQETLAGKPACQSPVAPDDGETPAHTYRGAQCVSLSQSGTPAGTHAGEKRKKSKRPPRKSPSP